MKKLRCIAVDDEKFALDLLADNIGKIPYLDLVASCKNVMEAAESLQEHKVDLLFIDIQMPGLSGLQFVKSLSPKPLVIFVTAYENYALNAFDVDAVDYLVKPVTPERFLQAANKALLFSSYNQSSLTASIAQEFVFFNVEYNLVKIILADILYIEGLKDYIKIYLRDTEWPLLTKVTMKALEELLPASKFIRVHRSYFVSIASIGIVKKDSIILTGNQRELPIGASFRERIENMTQNR